MTNEKKDVEFQVIDWDYTHDEVVSGDGTIKKYMIRLYGTTRENKKIFVKVKDYPPYFYVEIPKGWKHHHLTIFVAEIKKYIKIEHIDSLKDWDVVDRHIFWEFTNYEMFPFLRLIFHNMEGFRAYERALNRKIFNRVLDGKAKKYKIYESNIEPMLRMAHIRKLNLCGWIKIKDKNYSYFSEKEKPSYNEINIQTKWTNLEPIEDTSIVPLTIAAFDLECTSGDGSFPQAKRDDDKIIQIGTTFSRYGENECYLKHIITLGSCDPIEGIEVESYDNEVALLLAWTNLIRKTNPDIITGYNIFGFDFKYLEERAKKLGCYSSFSKLGRVQNEISPFIEKTLSSSALGDNKLNYYAMQGRVQIDILKLVQRDFKLSSYKLDSVASEFIREIVKEVEIDSDIEKLKSIMNDYVVKCKEKKTSSNVKLNELNKKLKNDLKNFKFVKPVDITSFTDKIIKIKEKNYDFGNIISEFITDKIKSVKVDEIKGTSTIYTNGTYGMELGRVIKIIFNDGLSDNSYKNEAKFKVIGLTDKSIIIDGILEGEALEYNKYKTYWAQAKDDVSPQDIFRFQKGTSADRRVIAIYCIQDCTLCNKLINKLHILTNNIGMANVCNVPLSYIFLRGQGVKIFSLVSKKCRERNHVIPVIRKPYKPQQTHESKINIKIKTNKDLEEIEEDDTGYEGATVFHPHKGIHFEPITVLDYNSLYPNSMIYRNISHECIVKDPKYDNLPGYYYQTVTSIYNGVETTCKYAKSLNNHNQTNKIPELGILPEILKELLDARARMRTLMENESDKFKAKILDGLQNAYKVTSNSLYGQCGAPTSPIYMKDIAASTTATGREMLNVAKIFAEKMFPMLINSILFESYESYENKINLLFAKKIEELLGEEIIKDLKKDHKMFDIWGKPMVFEKNKKIGAIIGIKNSGIVVEKKGDQIIEEAKYKYLRILKENRETIDENYHKFQDKKLNHKTKTDFIKWSYDKIKGLLTDKKIDPKVIYGDTDSIFVTFQIRDTNINEGIVDGVANDKLPEKESLKISIDLGIMCSKILHKILPSPQNAAYEKSFLPFVIITKKRYVGNKYEFDPEKYYQNSMGIVLKRRDNAPIVKIVVGGIVKSILNDKSPEKAIKFAKETIKKILSNKYTLDKYIITKTLKGNGLTAPERLLDSRKSKEQRSYAHRTRIVQAVLADRMTDRDPGNRPLSNERISYAYIITDKEVELQGDRVETPEYIVDNNLKLDYLFYITNQIMKPSMQFLQYLTDQPKKIFDDFINRELNRRVGKKPVNYYFNIDTYDPFREEEEGSNDESKNMVYLMNKDFSCFDNDLIEIDNETIEEEVISVEKNAESSGKKKKRNPPKKNTKNNQIEEKVQFDIKKGGFVVD